MGIDPMAVVDPNCACTASARGRHVRHADGDLRQHQRGHHHDRREAADLIRQPMRMAA
jgi:hypothetical protein